MQVELQPKFLDMNKSWILAQGFIMAKHEEIRKGLIREERMELGENLKDQKRRKRKK